MNRIISESRDSVTCAICTDIFEDPRILRCSHSFCLHCLIAFRGGGEGDGDKFCPICRENTVPPIDRLQTLPRNEFANRVAGLIKEEENPVQPSAPPAEEDETDGDEGFYTGPSLEPKESDGNGSIGISAIVGGIVGFCLAGPVGSAAGFVIGGVGYAAVHGVKADYKCDGCSSEKFSRIRYKCGMCPEFMLCPSCFGSEQLIQLHNAHHVFLKLNSPPKRQLPADSAVLKPEIAEMVASINYKSTTHGKAYVHTPERLKVLSGIQCMLCRANPIKGVRYKCGMCPDYDLCGKCEPSSAKSHDKRHVFMALKHHMEINIQSKPLIRAHFY